MSEIIEYSGPEISGIKIEGIANPEEIQVLTEPLSFGTGVPLEERITARPELNGKRIKTVDSPAIYLVIDGYRRGIPNPSTYNNLFRDWNNILISFDITSIPVAPSISSGALLVKSSDSNKVFLLSDGQKRHISSPKIMDKYNFNWDRVNIVAPIFLSSIPTGAIIQD